MRYMGQATIRSASPADQEYYHSVEDFCRAENRMNALARSSNDPALLVELQESMDRHNESVTGVVESTVAAVSGETLRGHPHSVWNGFMEHGQPYCLCWDDDSRYYLVGTQVWQVADVENLDDWDELELLLRAAARRRQQKHERRLMDARRILDGEGDETATRRKIPDGVKMFVWQRDGGSCVNCGANADLEFDHLIPLSMGGADTARNLQLLCGSCNRAKGGNLI